MVFLLRISHEFIIWMLHISHCLCLELYQRFVDQIHIRELCKCIEKPLIHNISRAHQKLPNTHMHPHTPTYTHARPLIHAYTRTTVHRSSKTSASSCCHKNSLISTANCSSSTSQTSTIWNSSLWNSALSQTNSYYSPTSTGN